MRGGLGWSGSMSARGWAVSAAECAPVVPRVGMGSCGALGRGGGGGARRREGRGGAVHVRAICGSGKDRHGGTNKIVHFLLVRFTQGDAL